MQVGERWFLSPLPVQDTRKRLQTRFMERIRERVEDKLLDGLVGPGPDSPTRQTFRSLLREGKLENREAEYEVTVQGTGEEGQPPRHPFLAIQGLPLGRMGGPRKEVRRMKVSEARKALEEQEAHAAIPQQAVVEVKPRTPARLPLPDVRLASPP